MHLTSTKQLIPVYCGFWKGFSRQKPRTIRAFVQGVPRGLTRPVRGVWDWPWSSCGTCWSSGRPGLRPSDAWTSGIHPSSSMETDCLHCSLRSDCPQDWRVYSPGWPQHHANKLVPILSYSYLFIFIFFIYLFFFCIKEILFRGKTKAWNTFNKKNLWKSHVHSLSLIDLFRQKLNCIWHKIYFMLLRT